MSWLQLHLELADDALSADEARSLGAVLMSAIREGARIPTENNAQPLDIGARSFVQVVGFQV